MGDLLLEWFQTLALLACCIAIYANYKTINILMELIDQHEDNLAKVINELPHHLTADQRRWIETQLKEMQNAHPQPPRH